MADASQNQNTLADNDAHANIFSHLDSDSRLYGAFTRDRTTGKAADVVSRERLELMRSYSSEYEQVYSSMAHLGTSVAVGRVRHESQCSIVDGLLSEIYDRWQDHRHDSFDSDTFTECSSTSEVMHWRRCSVFRELGGYLHRGVLQEYSTERLRRLVSEMLRRCNQTSARLVKQLKRRERRTTKLQNNCDIVTAIIQASSQKRRIDTKMRFTVEPTGGDSAFEQWKDAMNAVARLPLGIPDEFRRKVWLTLADHHIRELKIDWDKTVRFAFNERSNPDDNKLGLQIVKDLHRTGCSGFSGEDNEEERALLKRILLAYARWNKAVGYCQGFNVIAALLLEVMDRREADALKVMIYLIDHVLPQSYFANNLRALSVDMAVFRDLLKIFPKLSRHLDYLQHAQDQASGGCYEPPLTNVFTMQWFLTLFATCLPKATVLRVWDSILLDGSEILLRTALTIWGKLSSRILTVSTADEFYTLMGDITQEMLEGNILDADAMIKNLYSIAPFPFPQLTELREKYTYNIRPFTPAANKKASWLDGAVLPSDEDDLEDEDIEAITCFTGFIPAGAPGSFKGKGLDGDQRTSSVPDIASLGPGAYGLAPSSDSSGVPNVPAYMERMTTDIGALKKQYAKLRQRQTQAHIILSTASARQQQQHVVKSRPMMPKIETPTAVNHLFIAKQGLKGKNRCVAAGPRIANMYPITTPGTSTKSQVQPISPHVLGDTKCKWVQDSRKEGPKKKMDKQYNNTRPTQQRCGTDTMTTKGLPCPVPELPADCHGNQPISEADTGRLNADVLDEREAPDSPQHDDSGLGNSLSSPVHSTSSSNPSPNHNAGTSNPSPNHNAGTSVSQESVGKQTSGVKLEEFCRTTEDVWDIDVNEADVGATERVLDASETGAIKQSDTEEVHKNDEKSKSEVIEVHKITNTSNSSKSTDNDEGVAVDCSHSDVDSNASSMQKDSQCNESPSKAMRSQSDGGDTTLTREKQRVEEDLNAVYGVISHKSKEAKVHHTGGKAAGMSGSKRTDSSTSGASGCTTDSENMTEVFSPDHDSQSKSFQQYYSIKRTLSVDSSHSLQAQLKKCSLPKKSFNPFPVKHVNQNRAKTGVKLGLYKPGTLEQYERSLKSQAAVWGK